MEGYFLNNIPKYQTILPILAFQFNQKGKIKIKKK